MKKLLFAVSLIITSLSVFSQTTYDSKTLVDTNNNSNSTVTSTNTNNSNNVNVTTVTSTNTNNNNNVSVSENTNINSGHTTSDNKNTNINANYSTSTSSQMVNSTNNSSNYNKNDIEQKIVQPPPTAIAPNMMSGGNNDLCSTGVGGALQTQILGLSGGKTTRDFNCERLKLSKTMYDMGMKVAAVSVLCQDRRVFDAMMEAGTPCPFEGKIGEAARQAWLDNPSRVPQSDKEAENVYKNTGTGIISRIINWLF